MELSINSQPLNTFYLFDQISISDLLQIEQNLPPSHLLLSTYINTLTPTPVLTTIPPSFHPDSIIIQESFTTVLHSSSTIVLYISEADLKATRASMKNSSGVNSLKPFQVSSPYIVLSIIKLWLKFKSDLLSFIDKLNYCSLAQESATALELFLYSKAGVEKTLSLLQRAKQRLGVKVLPTVKVFRPLAKPMIELGVSREKCERESLSYTESDTEEMDELSFRVSELFKEKFPRFSAASITVMDTPGKEVRKSYLEYSEMIESPRYHLNNYIKTPLDSPKQAPLTIGQVKERLGSAGSVESSPSKPESKSKRNKFDFESEVIKSLNTELTGCSESLKVLGPYENRARSCQCSTCTFM